MCVCADGLGCDRCSFFLFDLRQWHSTEEKKHRFARSPRDGRNRALTTAKQYCLDLVTISRFGTVQHIDGPGYKQWLLLAILTNPIKFVLDCTMPNPCSVGSLQTGAQKGMRRQSQRMYALWEQNSDIHF